jgi:rod shape-determining protein MreC
VETFWKDYVDLVDVRRENRELRSEVERLRMRLAQSLEQAREAERLKDLLAFSPPEAWDSIGARIIAHRLGPNAALKTVLVDKGTWSGIEVHTPMVTPKGVAGRVLRAGPKFSTALLITDRGSRISVIGRLSRTPGILAGQGPDSALKVEYVHQNAPIAPGEVLVTSGLDGIFPKGLPVAAVTNAQRSEISLFQEVSARPLVNLRRLEEVLLLIRRAETMKEQDALPDKDGPGDEASGG